MSNPMSATHFANFYEDPRYLDIFSENNDLAIDEIVGNWAQENVDQILKAYELKGGWEGWAQVEIALKLKKEMEERMWGSHGPGDAYRGVTTDIRREVQVYSRQDGSADSRRADILIMRRRLLPGSQGGHADDFIIIELKCESAYNEKDFINAVKADVEKISGGFVLACQPAKVWAFSFSVSDGGHQKREREKGSCIKEIPATAGAQYGKVKLWLVEEEMAIDRM